MGIVLTRLICGFLSNFFCGIRLRHRASKDGFFSLFSSFFSYPTVFAISRQAQIADGCCALTGLDIYDDVNPGRRSLCSLSPGYHISGFQPEQQDALSKAPALMS